MNKLIDEFDDPVLFSPTQLVSTSKLVRNLSKYLDQAQKRPIFVSRDQKIEAVLMHIDEYRDLLRKLETMRSWKGNS